MNPSPDAWRRIGDMLVTRRVAIDPTWRNRQRFIEATGLNERLVADLENGRRQSYRDSTLRAVEHAYRLPTGAIDAALTDPTRVFPDLARPVGGDGHGAPLIPDDVNREDIPAWEWHLWNTPILSVEERRSAIRIVRLVRGELGDDPDALLALAETLQRVAGEFAHRRSPSRAG